MTYEQKVKTFICIILAAISLLPGFMSYAVKDQHSSLKRIDRLLDKVERELSWRKL